MKLPKTAEISGDTDFDISTQPESNADLSQHRLDSSYNPD